MAGSGEVGGVGEIKMGVVGVGRIGIVHAATIAHQIGRASLVGVTTGNEERAAMARSVLGGVPVYRNMDELLEKAKPDAVVIASRTAAHVENVKQAAEAKAHIFCEKPLALSIDGCDGAINAARAAGVKLMLGHVRRFDSGYRQAKRLIDEGAIGKPVVYRAIAGDQDAPPPSFANPAVSGGLITDAGYHDVYLALWLMDSDIVRAGTEAGVLVLPEIGEVGDVDNAVVNFRFASGAIGNLFVSRTTCYGHDVRGDVIGEKGGLHVGYLRRTPVNLLTREGGLTHDLIPDTSVRYSAAFGEEMHAFVDALLEGKEPPVPGEDGKKVLAVCLAATKSIHTGRPEDVEL